MDDRATKLVTKPFIRLQLHWQLYNLPITYLKHVRNIIPDKSVKQVLADPVHPGDKTRMVHKHFSAN